MVFIIPRMGCFKVTNDQIKYRNFLIKQFNAHNDDIVSTISYITRHQLPRDIQAINRGLSIPERNEVIKEICMLGD